MTILPETLSEDAFGSDRLILRKGRVETQLVQS